MFCSAAQCAAGGSFGGGSFGGGGATGGWDPVVTCDNHNVGYSDEKNCNEYKGNAPLNRDHASKCRRKCTDVNGKGMWMWSVIDCVNGYHLEADGICHKDVQQKATAKQKVVAKEKAVAKIKAHGKVLILDEGGTQEPAIGASVQFADNLSIGVAADMDGNFELGLDNSSGTLLVSYIGYHKASVPVSECVTGCTIKLETQPVELGEAVKVACGPTVIKRLTELAASCHGTNSATSETIGTLQKYCENPDTETDFDTLYKKLDGLTPTQCPPRVSINDLQDTSRRKILSSVTLIRELSSGLGTSVWKNKEGNFNTSRLVSDSVAGVVLGTVGGLVTSKVVKNNQIKGGFEDITCSVAGQNVANYGDQFVVMGHR